MALFDDPHPEDYFELARLIIYARERSWTPVEYGAQPAIFVQAFEIFLPEVARLVEEVHERMRNEKAVTHGGNIPNPRDHPRLP